MSRKQVAAQLTAAVPAGPPPGMDYQAQLQAIARQRAIAQQLGQPPERTSMAGGLVVPYSAGEGLTRLGQAFLSKKMNDQLDTKESTARGQYQAGRTTAIGQIAADPTNPQNIVTARDYGLNPGDFNPAPIVAKEGDVLLDPRTKQPLYTNPKPDNWQHITSDNGQTITDSDYNPRTRERIVSGTTQKLETPDQKAKNALATSGALSDAAKDLMVDRLLSGEKPNEVLGNLGRGQQGASDLRDVQNRLADTAKARGIGGPQLLGLVQDTAATGRELLQLGLREGQIAPRAEELDKFIQQAKDASAKVPRGNWTDLTKVLQFGASHVSDPNLGALQVAVNAVINARAAAIGGGVIHVEDQKTGHDLISAANGPQDFEARMEQMRKEAQGALQSPQAVRQRITESRGGTAPSQAKVLPTANAKGWILHQDAQGNKAYVDPTNPQNFEEVR